LLSDFEREKQDTFAITADMTRQYKAMQVADKFHSLFFSMDTKSHPTSNI
jgi:hypothetical protein